MAFINEKLTVEQRKEFMSRGIKKPTSNYAANPIYCTIDVERNMSLWHLGNLGRDDYNHHMFLFDWHGEQHTIIMKYVDPDPTENCILWSLSKYEKNNISGKPFVNDFKEALMKYAIDGNPEQQETIDVMVEIERRPE